MRAWVARCLAFSVIGVLLCVCFSDSSPAQVAGKVAQPKAPPPKTAPPPSKGKGPKLPDPEDVSLETKDGVSLKAM